MGDLNAGATNGRCDEIRPCERGDNDLARIDLARMGRVRATRLGAIQFDSPPRVDSRMAVSRVRRGGPRANVRPVDGHAQHDPALRAVQIAELVVDLRGVRWTTPALPALEGRQTA